MNMSSRVLRAPRTLLLCIVVAQLAVAGCGLPLTGTTARVRRGSGSQPAIPVASLQWVTLGGAKQSVLVRGADRTRPIVLFLHGGPGMPAMYLAHAFQQDLEQSFVVVHWDRRGAGKSYAARLPVESLTVRRTLDDLYELREWLRRNVGDNRVLLVGHSWGSYLGLMAVHERPQDFAAYIATGVISPDTAGARIDQRRCVMEGAIAVGDTALARRLGAPPSDSSPHVTESMEFHVGGELFRARSMWPIIRVGFGAPEYTLLDAMHVQKGAQFVGAHMRRNVDDRWMLERPELQVPVIFALGRHDCNAPSDAARRFFDTMRAPWKSIWWFDSSSHFPFWEEPGRFRLALLQADSISAASLQLPRRP
jgi:pimeloyl-ACP methyl ester carboxylesterase